jgi:hypothetical protein
VRAGLATRAAHPAAIRERDVRPEPAVIHDFHVSPREAARGDRAGFKIDSKPIMKIKEGEIRIFIEKNAYIPT